MKALLVCNPHATTTDDRLRDVIAAALSSAADLEVVTTEERGHATRITADAVAEGVDVVFALGGDGTANEVVQALAGTDVTFGAIPGGGTNVLARALGLPNDPVAATATALDLLRAGKTRRIGLGRANDRWFTFNAGLGFDASVVHRVESSPRMKRRLRQSAFVLLAVRDWFGNRDVRNPSIEVTTADGQVHGPFGIAILGNTDPYTYLGSRPMQVTPDARFELGVDLLAIGKVTTVRVLRVVVQVFTGGRHIGRKHIHHWHDQQHLELRSPAPLPTMVDGDHVGHVTLLRVEAVPDALRVLA